MICHLVAILKSKFSFLEELQIISSRSWSFRPHTQLGTDIKMQEGVPWIKVGAIIKLEGLGGIVDLRG